MKQRQWAPPSTLPDPHPRPGWVHRWIRHRVLGTDDAMRASAAMREGWEPCKLADYPEMRMAFHSGASGQVADMIQVGALMLCRMPKEVDDQRKEYYAGLSERQSRGVDAQVRQVSDHRVPLTSEFRSGVEFGKRGGPEPTA